MGKKKGGPKKSAETAAAPAAAPTTPEAPIDKAAYQAWIAANDAPPGKDGLEVTDMGEYNGRVTATHDIRIDEGGECICLALTEGKLRFDSPVLRAFQVFTGL